MANTTDTTSLFRLIALFTALVLVAAGGLMYLQSGSGDSDAASLAALSQVLPERARAAARGDDNAFDRFASSVARVAELRRGAGDVPGRVADWQALEQGAGAIVQKRAAIEPLASASNTIATAAAGILSLSNDLLDRSGRAAVVQDLQQRAERLRVAAAGLASAAEPATTLATMSDDAAAIDNIVRGFAGQGSTLDVRALDADGQQAVVAPMAAHVAAINDALPVLSDSADELAGLRDDLAELDGAATRLMQSAYSTAPSGMLSGITALPWLPLALVGLGIVLVSGLVLLNTKIAVFERTAKEHAEQNERNQQAILRLLDEMGSLADGDLTVEATVTEDITGTIADSFNYAIEELRKLVTTVNETAIMVDSAAKQTESTAAHMARAAENQTREIAAATESIVSMAASIEEVSGNAERSSDVARHSVEVAHKGGEAVRRTIDGMNTIRETIQDTSKRIKRLGESSQEIGNIVELINDIAEQTNILALNASIQASMAGEAGRGFAVVADEVQRLAERSTNATKQIEVLVSTIQADTKEAVVSMERSTTDVVGGALLAENAGAALDEIEQVSNQIASLVQNISSSARQQASSAADVTRRTTRLSEISEQTGKATTATAAAISKLSEFASQLRKTVAGFTLPNDPRPATQLRTTSTDATGARGQRPTGTG